MYGLCKRSCYWRGAVQSASIAQHQSKTYRRAAKDYYKLVGMFAEELMPVEQRTPVWEGTVEVKVGLTAG